MGDLSGRDTSASAVIIRADARTLPLPDESVDLIVASPPYWQQRVYRDGGEAYVGQIGTEPTPAGYVTNLVDVTRECVRVLKPSGSMFFNVGDKYNSAGSKSLFGFPWRFALGCVDQLGLFLRRDIIWSKGNPLPDSAKDRFQSTHEYLFHFVKQPRYFSAADEVREPLDARWRQVEDSALADQRVIHERERQGSNDRSPLGRLPGSVWSMVTEPLITPAISPLDGRPLPNHHAAFPTEISRRCVLGWSPSGICVGCGEGRRPVVKRRSVESQRDSYAIASWTAGSGELRGGESLGLRRRSRRTEVAIIGYSCACPEPTALTRPAVVLDVFGGTGTTALVASVLGRVGVSVDASHDYCRLARWRTTDPGQRAKAMRTPKPKPLVRAADQGDLFAV